MKHKSLSLYVPCLEGGYEDAGRVDLAGYTLISDERLYDFEAAEQDAIEQARLNGLGVERELALMAKLEVAEKERDALRAKIEQMEKRLRLILEEPENTMSNSKAMREMLRQARLALEESK